MRKLNPGPLATPRQADKAAAEALALLDVIIKNALNLSGAAKYIRRKRPSAPAIAALGFIAYRVLRSERQRSSAKHKHKGSMPEKIESLDIQNIHQAREKAPELFERHESHIISQAIARYKRERNNLP